jgi:hypothetical protein
MAYRNRWRRPWDGPDGREFSAWLVNRNHPEIPLNWEKILIDINKLEGTVKYDEEEDDDTVNQEDYALSLEGTEYMGGYMNMYVAMYLERHKAKTVFEVLGNSFAAVTQFITTAIGSPKAGAKAEEAAQLEMVDTGEQTSP